MRWTLPVLFALVAIATRVPVLLAHLDTWYPFEVHSGTIAQALMDGVRLDVPKLPIIPHIRGGVVSGYLLVPLYEVLGVSAASMKALPLVWHGITVFSAVYVIQRFFSRPAAIAVGAILCAAPPMYAKLSVLGLASHMESALPFLLALMFYLSMTIERRFSLWNAGLFGASVGLCGFFHLQALLPALILLGALFVIEYRSVRWLGALVVIIGVAVGSAPSLGFEGGNFTLLSNAFNGESGGDFGAEDQAESREGSRLTTAVTKLAGLAGGDFAGALEFEEIPAIGQVASWIYAIALLLTASYALLRDRNDMMIRIRAAIGKGRPEDDSSERAICGQTVVLATHVLAVLLMFAISYVQTRTLISSGAANRFMAPLLFSSFLLSGIGIGSLVTAGRKHIGWALLIAMVVPGAMGIAATSKGEEVARWNQRGECYEWFVGYLQRETRGDPARLALLIDRVDQGDPRFQTLRFKVPYQRRPGPPKFKVEGDFRNQLEPKQRLFAATWYGQRFVQHIKAVAQPRLLISGFRIEEMVEKLEDLPDVEQIAMLHGMGLALDPPRAGKDPEQHEAFYVSIGMAADKLPQEVMTPIIEGHGFRLGTVFNAYSDHMIAQVHRCTQLPLESRKAFARGLGWGLAQRYLEPPETVPAGHKAREQLPEDVRVVFDAAFTGTRLPREAIVLSRAKKD